MNKYYLCSFFISMLVSSCSFNEKSSKTQFAFSITNLSDEQYPDNPDIGFRAHNYQNQFLDSGTLNILDSNILKGTLAFSTLEGPAIIINNLDFEEFIPTIPNQIKKNEYLSYISCINQEWNRNQVRFNTDEFKTKLKGISRIDIARNCLNAYLWEIILYTEENGKELPYAHGWFNFPKKVYNDWFEMKNGIAFDKYRSALENWVDPASKKVDLNKLRIYHSAIKIDSFKDLSDEMYPVEGARKKKYKEVIYPISFSSMRDLQTDSALFATFTPPGFYNKKDPRTTELGRFINLKNVVVSSTANKLDSSSTTEIRLTFTDSTNRTTHLVLGGLNLNEFPVLEIKDANNGWKNSMGIGNHTFYEDTKTHNQIKAATNPYYGLILDGDGKWLDSHKIGIDGPIIHFSDDDRKTLNIWLLSFERHALVGHYQIVLN